MVGGSTEAAVILLHSDKAAVLAVVGKTAHPAVLGFLADIYDMANSIKLRQR